jgi:GTPase SAR1 family protein
MYLTKVLPCETMFKFPDFHSPSITQTDFDAKPMVLLMGQYSTGKTSFIRFLLERDFPGANIGPEPTTDRFTAIMHGPERVVPGNAVAASADMPFTALGKFGMAFLNRFESSHCTAPILEKITFIDTPGILSGEKQRVNRGYNFTDVAKWFAERCDRILLLFDANKLDISDEFKEAILVLKGHDDKIRCILNKADGIPHQALIRVYGALMWSLGKVVQTPEVMRVYMGSFWDQPLKNKELEKLFAAESGDLLADLRSLPRNATVRKLNELIKRARMLKVHVHLIDHLTKQFTFLGSTSKTVAKFHADITPYFTAVQSQTNLPRGDFPKPDAFVEVLKRFGEKIKDFPNLESKKNAQLLADLDSGINVDVPALMKQLPSSVESGSSLAKESNPFEFGSDSALVSGAWAVSDTFKRKYDTIFYGCSLIEGKLKGADARDIFIKSQLPTMTLKCIWELADCDRDGLLDVDEFAVAMTLIECHKAGLLPEIPENLPTLLVPPVKRDLYDFF